LRVIRLDGKRNKSCMYYEEVEADISVLEYVRKRDGKSPEAQSVSVLFPRGTVYLTRAHGLSKESVHSS
jgi:hypothetical protein